MLLRADTILALDGSPPYAGAVRVEGSIIRECGSALQPVPGEEVLDLGDAILMPGLINAHCHLDYTGFRRAIFPGKSFADWIKQINALKGNFTPADYLSAIQEGFRLLQQGGCTTVLNIECFPELLVRLPPPPLRTWWFLELIDIRQRIQGDEMLLGALQFFESHPDWLGGFGLSPHAPYTASIELYRLAKRCSEELAMPFTTHIAESVEEQDMFLRAQGPLYEFLEKLGRNMSDCGQGSSLSHLMEFGLLNDHCLAVHMNYLQDYDFASLSRRPLHIVHCPLCHDYFGHARFPLEDLEAAGCNICLGTDSLASNDTLDLRAEIRCAREQYPDIAPRRWIEMATLHPARALRLENKLGILKPGAWADLAAFDFPADAPREDPWSAVINGQQPPRLLMVNGRVVAFPS